MKIATLLREAKLEKTNEFEIIDKVKRVLKGKSWLTASVMYDDAYNTINLIITNSKKPLFTPQYFSFEADKANMRDVARNSVADARRFMQSGAKISLYNPHKGHHLTSDIKDLIIDLEEKIDAGCNFILTTGRDYIDGNSPLAKVIENFDANVKTATKLRSQVVRGIPKHAKLHALDANELITPTGEWRVSYELGIRMSNTTLRHKLAYDKPTRVSYLRGAEYTPEKLLELFVDSGEDKAKWTRFFDDLKEVLKYKDDDYNGRNIIKVYVEGISDDETV